MELLREYNSDSESSEPSTEPLEKHSASESRSVYLITYSQADKTIFPTREEFALAVVRSFSFGKTRVQQWCCAEEKHRNTGEHYHLAIKLTQNQRWLTSKKFLMANHGVSVHYSGVHHDYYSAWKYVTKSDKEFVESENHPRLREAQEPRTGNASRARCKRKVKPPARYSDEEQSLQGADVVEGPAENETRRKRKKRLTGFDVSQIIVEQNITNLTELQALAFEQKEEGKTDLTEFLLNRTPRAIAHIMQSTWEIQEARGKLERAKKSRMELLHEAKSGECAEGCNGDWLRCAEEILCNNGLTVQYFGGVVRELLTKGRGKFRNLMLTGPANCGKTFLLDPLTLIFNTFCNPASGSFAWIGAETAECIFLNDFR